LKHDHPDFLLVNRDTREKEYMNILVKPRITAWSLTFILVLICVFPAAAQRDVPDEVPRDKNGDPDCRECHWETFLDWEHSIHGQGLSCGQCHLSDQQSHARQGHGSQGGPEDCMACHTTGYNAENDTWEEDNIHCKACHTPIEQNHPEDIMPTNRSSELCGGCHIQAFFEWQESKHRIEEVACIDCHSQHTTDLRFAGAVETCAQCHESRVEEFMHSGHKAADVSCADCHLSPLDGPIGSGSAKLNHTFFVELETCTACHLEELHAGKQTDANSGEVFPEDDYATSDALTSDAMASSMTVEVTQSPRRANTLQFAVIGGMAVLGIGITRGRSLLNRLSKWRKKRPIDE